MNYYINGFDQNGSDVSWIQAGMIFSIHTDRYGKKEQYLTILKEEDKVYVEEYHLDGEVHQMTYYDGLGLTNEETCETIETRIEPPKGVKFTTLNAMKLIEETKKEFHFCNVRVKLEGLNSNNIYTFAIKINISKTDITIFEGNSFEDNNINSILKDARKNLETELEIIKKIMINLKEGERK